MNFEAQESYLLKMGWGEFFRAQLTADELAKLTVARIVEPARGLSRAACAIGEVWAECPDDVGVGDWVVGTLRGAGSANARLSVARLLTRRTKLSRKPPSGKIHEQILCANADVALVVMAMNQDLGLAGVVRSVTAIRAAGIRPALVLTKADACPSPSDVIDPIVQVLGDVPRHIVSVAEKTGLTELDPYFAPGHTIVLMGASGAGKSTLTNHLVEAETQLVGATRERDEKGRHTTTARRLHFLRSGAMIVDSPGIREFQPWVELPPLPKSDKPKKARPSKRGGRQYDEDEDYED